MQTVLFRFVCYKREWRKCLSMVGNGKLRQDRLNGQQKSRCSARRCAITTLKRGSRNSLNAMSTNVWTMTTMHILCSFISVIFNTYWWSSNICVKMNLCYRWAAWYGVRLLKKFKKGTPPVVYWHNILNGRFLCVDLAVSSQLISDFTSHANAHADPREAVNRRSCAAFYLVQKVDRLTSLTLVADREESITHALQQVMPQSSIIYWWNHILGDVQKYF